MAERGCGTRKKGGIYAVCGMSENGLPLSHFMMCPPRHIEDPSAIGLSYQGVTLMERPSASGTFDMWDIVGKEHYPYFPDFVEEGMALRSFSRRIPKSTNFGSLTPESRHMILHPRGFITSDRSPWRTRRWFFPGTNSECPKYIEPHVSPPPWGDVEMCLGMLWEAIPAEDNPATDDVVLRKRPSFEYSHVATPEGASPKFDLALCMWLPITKFEVIADPGEGTHQDAVDALENSGTELPFTLEME
jgi:hypothetical protein